MIFVPEALNSIVQPISNLTTKMGLTIKEVRDIQYGKKFVFEKENDFAEINVFYGKSGFTTVITPKRGHSPQLSEAAVAIIEKVLFDNPARLVLLNKPDNLSAGTIVKDIELN